MPAAHVEARIAAPVERVFAISSDVAGYADNMSGIDGVEILTDGDVGPGTRWRETRTLYGRSATEEMWISGFEPPHSFTVEADSHGARYVSTFRFLPDGDGTRVTLEFTARPTTLAARVMSLLLGRVMVSGVRKALEADLADLKRVAEAAGG